MRKVILLFLAVAFVGITQLKSQSHRTPCPRWSKRGMYVEYAGSYLDSTSKITPLVTYCRNNHITYVNLGGLSYGADPKNWVFSMDSVWVNPKSAPKLENLIDSLKTRGHVEEVGVMPYSDINTQDSNSFSIKNYDLGNFGRSVHTYNSSVSWTRKVDILSMDDEWWIQFNPGHTPAQQANETRKWFSTVSMPLLKSMYNAAHACPSDYLRTEIYIGTPMNPWARTVPDSTYTNWTESMEIDSVCHYADRIIMSSYTYYANVLWNRGDFSAAYKEIGRDTMNRKRNNYYKKEIWPIFSAENYSRTACPANVCYFGIGNDFSGAYMCDHGIGPDALEQIYYDSLSFGMNHRVWTPDNLSGSVPMGADTNFKIAGNMWYDYDCMKNWKFDTNVNTGAIQYNVSLGHDTAWHNYPITLKANVQTHNPATFTYTWYDENNNDMILQSSNSNTYTVSYPTKISVVAEGVVGSDTITAYDYVNVYDSCYVPSVIYTGVNQLPSDVASSYKVYPNPANNRLTIEGPDDPTEKKYIEIYDMVGQKVRTEELVGSRTTIEVSTLQPSVYFYRITNASGNILKTDKLVIVH